MSVASLRRDNPGMTAATLMAERAITLDRLTLGYDGKAVVEDVSGAIAEGAMLALVGPNGAGKSTLLRALAGLHRPMSGSIGGLAEASPRIAYMPQHGEIDRAFPMSVLDFVAMGLWHEIGWWRPITRPRIAQTHAALARVGLTGAQDQRVGALSGGQLRRALFARAALQDASLLLLDEPFAGIDTATAEDLTAMLHSWHAEGRTLIVALHDLNRVHAHFPEALLLARKIVGRGKPADVLTEANLAVARKLCRVDDAPMTSGDRDDV